MKRITYYSISNTHTHTHTHTRTPCHWSRRYAEANGIVVLHPCTGGALNTTKYPNAPDVAQGKLDVYGQLDANYVQQSAPHMKAIGAMVRRVIPTGGEHSSTTPPTAAPTMAPTASATATLRVSNEMDPAQLHDAAATAAAAAASAFEGVVSTESVRMPTLNIDRANILTAGCSNTADFSTQVWYGLG